MARPKNAPDDTQERLRVIVQEQGPTLTRYALGLTAGNRAMAEDLVQEALVRAWRSIRTVPDDENGSRRWMFTVLRRLVIDDFRRRRHRPAVYGRADVATTAEADGSVLVIAEDSLRGAARRLSDGQRAVLFQVFYEDRPVDEVAGRLGIPVGTVRSRLHYGLRTLRRAVLDQQ
ncbi:sigma-70 family RNA polymerase sigma factor [Actinoplanes couchii]|uniref:RNA polymerase sigma factor n=1 Tax=Actinoplanes couchii TaxID=403638 RepID=A0ABQ3XP12_9ACTN|nr:sigma-70 family RNA polymerase sigma factor [Actinoplanes couchii]MDR6319605.1 RNA polymerase sigma-70 factor (ECF subfamily) [Actinoplanes couchii]GID60172.1 RNA polymerase sigma factor [Actinoplanes couchii]